MAWREGILTPTSYTASGRWSGRPPLHRAQRAGDPAGPLGGERRLLALHARRGDRRASGRRRPGRPRGADAQPVPARAADIWNASIERWTYVATPTWPAAWASRATTSGSRRPMWAAGQPLKDGFIPIKNRPPGTKSRPSQIVSPDALALVRFGLRDAHDPRIVNTVKASTPCSRWRRRGPAWHRYNDDGYGEQDDGARSTARASAGSGPCWSANARTTSWPPAAGTRPSA